MNVPREALEKVELTLYEVRAIRICCALARESGLLAPFAATLPDREEEAVFFAGLRSALVKLSDAEGRFPDVETSPQERLEIAAARAKVDQEQAFIVDPTRGEL